VLGKPNKSCGSSDCNAMSKKRIEYVQNKHYLEWVLEIGTFLFLLGTVAATCVGAYFAGQAADYTKRQWETALDSEQRQFGAYVSLRGVRLEDRGEGFFDLIPEWENTGGSETIGMNARTNMYLAKEELPEHFSFGNFQAEDRPISLGPKAVSNVAFQPIARNCIVQFNRADGFNKFYIWGFASYRDIFDKNHITRFCLDINKVIFSTENNVARISYGLCKRGNCIDDECKPPDLVSKISLKLEQCKSEPP